MYSILPGVVQSRIPTLPSIRRTFSGIRGRSGAVKSAAEIVEYPPQTPPPGYSSRPSSTVSNNSSYGSLIATDGDGSAQEDIPERPESSMSTPPPLLIPETRTGITWKYTTQGIPKRSSCVTKTNA